MLKDMSVPGHRHSASDIVRGTISPARLPSTVASQADLDDLSALVADLETDKADVGHTHDDRYYTESEADSLFEPIISDTGWVDVTVASGWTVNDAVQVRRIGAVVYWRGRVTPEASVSGTQTIVAAGGVPSWARPANVYESMRVCPSSWSSSVAENRVKVANVHPNGSVTAWYGTSNADPIILSGLSGYVVG